MQLPLSPNFSPTILCPHCKNDVRLTESLAAPLIESARVKFEAQARQMEEAITLRETELKKRGVELEKLQHNFDAQMNERLDKERASIIANESKRARQALSNEIQKAQEELRARDEMLKERDVALALSRKKELDLMRQSRELQEQKDALEITVERRLHEERGKIRDDARKSADEESRLRIAEKDKLINDMQAKVEELKRKVEQGSQQLQGEVQELELEALLRAHFPHDVFEPVAKGEHGGDLLQRVMGQNGIAAGTILWECKRTKHWQAGWLPKLRDDQRAAKADIAVIMSHVLPEEIDGFGPIDGVWCCSPKASLPVAHCLRQLLSEVSLVNQASVGQQGKMELVYQYLTGARFRQRVQAIIEAFSTMQDDLDKERRAITKQWAKRDEQITRAMQATLGMYGDLQAIAGKTLQELEGVGLDALAAPGADKPTDPVNN